MRAVIDSCVLISSLDSGDPFYAECIPILKKLTRFEVMGICPTLVLVETVCALRRRTGDDFHAIASCEILAHMPGIVWTDLSVAQAKRASALGVSTGLRGADTIMLYTARQYGIPLVTKDREIHTKATADTRVMEPASFLASLTESSGSR